MGLSASSMQNNVSVTSSCNRQLHLAQKVDLAWDGEAGDAKLLMPLPPPTFWPTVEPVLPLLSGMGLPPLIPMLGLLPVRRTLRARYVHLAARRHP